MSFQLTSTLSLLEALWIVGSLIALWFGRQNFWDAWADRRVGVTNPEHRLIANMWLLLFAFFGYMNVVFLAIGISAGLTAPANRDAPPSAVAWILTIGIISLQVFGTVVQGIVAAQRDRLADLILRRLRLARLEEHGAE